MKKNMEFADRVIRLIIVAALVLLYSKGFITGTLGVVGHVFAGVFTLTSLVSFCPLYPLFRINTIKNRRPQIHIVNELILLKMKAFCLFSHKL